MKTFIFSITILFSLFLISCSNNSDKTVSKYVNDEVFFTKSLETFEEVKNETAKLLEESKTQIIVNQIETKKKFHQVAKKSKLGILASQKVHNEFLDYLHPTLKVMYKDSFVHSFQVMADSFEKENYSKFGGIYAESSNRQNSFYSFMSENQESINKKLEYIRENKPSSPYWYMILWLLIFGFIFYFIAVISFSISVWGSTYSDLWYKTLFKIATRIIFGFGLLYISILWAAYWVFTTQYYMQTADESYNWLYYITNVFLLILFLILIAIMSLIDERERNTIETGSFTISFLIALIIFWIYPILISYKYISWLNEWIY